MKQKVMRVGNSLGVVVPSEFVKNVGIKPGDDVKVSLHTSKIEVVYKFSGIQQLSLGLKKIPALRHPEAKPKDPSRDSS